MSTSDASHFWTLQSTGLINDAVFLSEEDGEVIEVEGYAQVQESNTSRCASALSQGSSVLYDADWDDTLLLQASFNSQESAIPQAPTAPLSRLNSASETLFSSSFISTKRAASESPGIDLPQPKRTKSLTSATIGIDSCERHFNFIAHSPRHQGIFNKKRLSWGVQYEIARLVTLNRLKWDNISISDLDLLKGSSSEAAPKVAGILLKMEGSVNDPLVNHFFAKEQLLKTPYPELDREDEIMSTAGNLLGFSREMDGYFGGKVIQAAKLLPTILGNEKEVRRQLAQLPVRDRYRIQLERQELSYSTRLTRFYGSRRVLRVTLAKSLYHSHSGNLMDYFALGHVLNGRVFRVFAAKERNVYLVETNEIIEGCESLEPLDRSRMSITELVHWHNSLDFNGSQAMAKWSSRMGLCLSTSVPVVNFSFQNIQPIDDEYSADHDRQSNVKPKSEHVMTDGCGYINRSALLAIRDRMLLTDMPCAVQARLGGTKGMYMMHPDPGKSSDPPKAWYRPSQLKIRWKEHPDNSQLILDLVRLPHAKFPSRLSAETLVNLAHNGVSHQVFIDLLKSGLSEEVKALTTWSGSEFAMAELWDAVSVAGHVMGERLRRENASSARARRLILDDDDEADDAPDDEDAAIMKSAAWWPDEMSGCPSGLHESVCCLLTAGFTPDKNHLLFDKLEQVLSMAISKYVQRFKLTVPASVEAFVLPDPTGTLEEGQVFFSFSKTVLDPVTADPIQIITGPVIAGRHPCKLPTDLRKFTAVDCSALKKYTDVIIFSIKGKVSPLSYLGGGDYDGDTVTMVWEPSLVNSFNNAPDELAQPPSNLREQFEQSIETVEDFHCRMAPLPTEAIRDELAKVLLSPLSDTTSVGSYSTYHDKAVFRWGYEDPRTRRLAHMFTTQLDGVKSGLRVKLQVLKKDAHEWSQFTPLEWKTSAEEKERQQQDGINRASLRREKGLGKFVMEDLYKIAKEESKRHMDEYKKSRPRSSEFDEHLATPYRESRKRATEFQTRFCSSALLDDLLKLEQEVVESCDAHEKCIRKFYRPTTKSGKQATPLSIRDRQDIVRKLSLQFAKCFVQQIEGSAYSPEEAARIKASYAYIYGQEQKNYRFPFDVAFRELCAIKARALGPSSTVTQDMYNRMVIHRSTLRSRRGATDAM